jgi:signal transduction histidine kinase
MDVLTTLVVAWAAVYGYVALYYGLIYLRRPSDREYITFALLAAGLCVYSAAKAGLLGVTDPADAVIPSRFTWAGLMLAVAALVDHCHALTGQRTWLRPTGYAVGAIGAAASLAGLTVDPASFATAAEWGFPVAPDAPSLQITLAGTAVLAACLLVTAMALGVLAPHLTRDRDAKIMFVGVLMACAAGGHDLLVRAGLLRSLYLLEHVSMGTVVAMSYGLLQRFLRTNDELMARTEELRRSHAELRRTQEKLVLKEQLAAVGELSAVIAHEVRNPLAIIKNAVSGLRRSNIEAQDRRTLLGILGEETSRLARLVDDLLAYAQPMMPQDRAVPLDELVWGALDLARSGNPNSRGVAVTVDLHGAPDTLRGDPALLRQALMNLLDNALQAMPRGGDLTVRARSEDSDDLPVLVLEVSDTGEGMDTLVRQKACNPFFTTRPAGTGLGLAIVERVVRNHGGTLHIKSQHGSGTIVTLTFPPRGAPPAPAATGGTAGGGEPAHHAAQGAS